MEHKFRFTFKAWPAIAALTIGICFLTQAVAKLFGIELPDQQNVEVVKKVLVHAFENARYFWCSVLLVAQVLFIMPMLEEFIFRWLLVRLPSRLAERWRKNRTSKTPMTSRTSTVTDVYNNSTPIFLTYFLLTILSSVLFSAAHYITQPWPDAAFLALFFFGVAQCWLYRKTGNLWCAITNHAMFNLTNLVLLFIVPA